MCLLPLLCALLLLAYDADAAADNSKLRAAEAGTPVPNYFGGQVRTTRASLRLVLRPP